MNIADLPLMSSVSKAFMTNHPKVVGFFKDVFRQGIPVGTEFDITITKPGEKPRHARFKAKASDVSAINERVRGR